MTYYDTAYLAKCYLREPGSARVRAHATEAGRIACCELGQVELAGVFHRHLREGRLTPAEYGVLLRQFQSDQDLGIWEWLPVDALTLLEARRRFHKLSPRFFLRSADAIHLASALLHGFREVYSNDRHLLAACPVFDILGRNLLTS